MSNYTLALDGSTYAGSVALIRGEEVVAERTLADSGVPSRAGREERVLPSVAECLVDARVDVGLISRVICGAGPGSFTSLRIAASVAKGIAVGVGCPMFSVSSLLLTVAAAADSLDARLYLSVIPAMREEWFAMLVELTRDRQAIARGEPFVVADDKLSESARAQDAMVIGPGQAFDFRPHARGVARLMNQIIEAGPIAIETWEPDYGRLAEAQVRWEAAHGRPLGASA
jgi:tRNA threonylcarbamoyladenosine biosynthesis protein TsaB